MFCEKGVRTNFANSQENACARVSFLIKLQDQAWNIIKKETLAQVFPVNFAKCLRTVFITEQNVWVSINQYKCLALREKCLHLELFWSAFSRIRTKIIPNTETLYAIRITLLTNQISFTFLFFYQF